MKKTLKTGKKALSVFMAALMVLTTWVFFAPEKAEAATAGKYRIAFAVYDNDNGSNGIDKLTVKYKYKTNNGTGTESGEITTGANAGGAKGHVKHGHDYYIVYAENVPGFPSWAYASSKVGYWQYPEFRLKVCVAKAGNSNYYKGAENDANSGWKQVCDFEFHHKNFLGSDEKSNSTSDMANKPYFNSLGAISGADTITMPKTGAADITSKYSATMYDQYGVAWYQDPQFWVPISEPTDYNSAKKDDTSSGLSMAGNGTLTVRPSAQIDGNESVRYAWISCVAGTNKWAKKRIKLVDPLYTITFKQDGITNNLDQQQVYYGSTPTAPSNYTIPKPVEDGHYVFDGWNPALAKVTTDQTYWVQFKKIAHNWVRTSISDSTCSAEGKEYQKCTDCTATRELPVEKKPHTWVKGTVHAATCTTDGWTDYSCAKCPATKEDDKVPALGHDMKEVSRRDATCREPGVINYKCSRCTYTSSETIAIVPHSYTNEKVTKKQTCTTGGHATYQCIWCDKYDEARGGSAGIDTPALGHDWNYDESDERWEVVTPATCEKAGKEKRTCRRDSSHVETREIAALGHDYDKDITRTVPATCTKDGYTYHPCKHTDCDSYEVVETLTKLNHQDGGKGEWIITEVAKCETDGLKQYKCALCGEFVKNEVIPKLNHSFTKYEKTAEATCTENAKETATCTREGCGKTDTRDIENTKLGHNFLDENYKYNNNASCGVDGTETAKCTRCDVTDTRTAVGTALKHVFTVYRESKEATCLTNAEETAICDNGCGTTDTREVAGSALGHTCQNFTHDAGTETCCDLGTKTGVCTRCGVTYTVAEDRPEYYAAHTYAKDANGEIVYEFVEDSETCTEDGVERAYCINNDTHADGKNWNCGHYLERTAEGTKHAHTFPDEVTERNLYISNNDGTCQRNGTMYALCKECKKAKRTVTEPNSTKEHYVANWISDGNATCTEDGTKHGSCVYGCGTEFTDVQDVGSKLGHWFRDYKTTKDATCTTNRERTATCEREGCTATETIIDKGTELGHEWSDWTFVKGEEADCTKGGTMTRHCLRACCIDENGEATVTEEKVVDATAHTWVWEIIEELGEDGEPLPADCTRGYKKHQVCSVCETEKADSTVEVPGGAHHLVLTVNEEATCTEDGRRVIACDLCGYVESETIVPATGHVNRYLDEKTVKAATCKDKGYSGDYKCTLCDAVVEEGHETETTNEHVFSEYFTVSSATCTDNAKEKSICSVCGNAENTREIPGSALGHSFTKYVDDENSATCTKDGTKTAHCDRDGCDATKTVRSVGTALGHKWGEWITIEEATCAKVGKAERHCERCDLTVEKQLRKLSHSPSDWIVDKEASCTEEGKRHKECTGGCGYIFEEEVIPMLEHDFVVEVHGVTCIDDGYSTYTCSVCGATKNGEIVKALGHDWSGEWVVTKEPTCTKKGQETLTCTRCDKTQTRTIDALGHNEVIDPAVPATCTEPGLSEGSHCDRCGEILKEQETVIKPHRDADEDGKCDECGKDINHSTDLNCNCICHKRFWLMRVLYKVLLTFWKLFRIGKGCSCGAVHY